MLNSIKNTEKLTSDKEERASAIIEIFSKLPESEQVKFFYIFKGIELVS